MIHFDLPKQKSSIIKVIGVGGGGSNAVNYMFSQDIEGVDFIICNTDSKAIEQFHWQKQRDHPQLSSVYLIQPQAPVHRLK